MRSLTKTVIPGQAVMVSCFLFLFVSVSVMDSKTAYAITKEDGVVESLSALAYLASVLICLFGLKNHKNKPLLLFWLCLCLFFFGEETSWCQRVIGYSVSAVEQYSAQREFNIHNLSALSGGHWLSDKNSIRVPVQLSSQNLFRIGFITYFILIPLLMGYPYLRKLLMRSGYRPPSTALTVSIVFLLVTSFALAFITEGNNKRALAEVRELMYAVYILMYCRQIKASTNAVCCQAIG